ncbi:MAG: serine/threonine protein kinase [Planctomyces sp.]|nr:serine/threonine protein kinase [Planctomyces sp.]
MAADGAHWGTISNALKAEASGEHQPPHGAGSTLVPRLRSVGDEDDEFAGGHALDPTDFIVDFLPPSENADSLGRLGSIEIREFIGQGAHGIVLKGFQDELHRLVAVKVMAPHLASIVAARQRFAREARATAAIVHPNVMPILHVDSSARLPFLVMPYVDCESLQERLDREGPLPIGDVLRIAVQVARGLAAAHAQGLVHRDVKPANILLERGVERVMLTDFGLARAVDDATLTRSGLIAGTPHYMSPEQARGESVDVRSDLFSLGSVLYAMTAGRPPFRAETTYGILRRVTDEPARPLGELNPLTPKWFDALVGKLLEKSAADRFRSAEEVAQALEDSLAHLQQPEVCPLPQLVSDLLPERRAMRSRGAGLLAGIVLGGLLALVAVMTRQRQDPVDPAEGSRAAMATQSSERGTWDDGTDRQLEELADEADALLEATAIDVPD